MLVCFYFHAARTNAISLRSSFCVCSLILPFYQRQQQSSERV